MHEALDGAELVRDVEDRHAELGVELIEQRRERVLRLDVDAGRRLVEHEQLRPGRERLRDERALLLARRRAATAAATPAPASPTRSSASDDRLAILTAAAVPTSRSGARPASTTSRTVTGACSAELRALREIADPRALADRLRAGSPNSRTSPRVGRSSPSASRSSVVLPPPFGPAIATNSPTATCSSTSSSTGRPLRIREVDVLELDG